MLAQKTNHVGRSPPLSQGIYRLGNPECPPPSFAARYRLHVSRGHGDQTGSPRAIQYGYLADAKLAMAWALHWAPRAAASNEHEHAAA